jgi:hypothetical protein
MAADDLDLATPHTEMLGEQLDHSVVGRSVDRRSSRPHHKPTIARRLDSITSRPWDHANRNRARRPVHQSPPSPVRARFRTNVVTLADPRTAHRRRSDRFGRSSLASDLR